MSTRQQIPEVASRILVALELPNEEHLALEVAVVLVEFHQEVAAEAAEAERARLEAEG